MSVTHMNVWMLVGCVLCSIVSTAPARAAEYDEEIQITATRREEPAAKVPSAITVIGADALDAATPQTVMDALHGEPGTFVQQTTPGQGVVIVRGLKGSEVLHLVDGFRLNNAIFRNAPNQYIALVDSQSLDQIEVVRGPMSALYGSDALGGVVHMLSREPRFAGEATQQRVRLRTIYGTADRSLLARAEFAIGNESYSLSGGLTTQDTENLRRGDGDRIPATGFRSEGGDLKLVTRFGEAHELMLSVQQLKQPKTPRVDLLIPGFGQSQAEQITGEFKPQERSFYHARYRYQAPTALFDQLELHYGRQRIEDGQRARVLLNPRLDVRETLERTTDTTNGYTLQADKALEGGHFLTYGAEYYRDRVHSLRKLRDTVAGATGAFSSQAPRFPDGTLMEQMAVFAADTWSATPRLEVSYGLRYSLVHTDVPGGFERIRNGDVSGNLGVSYALRESTSLVLNVGRGFRAPNVFDLGTLGNRPGNRFNVPNPDLDPETVVTVDVGIKHASERAQAELSVFRSEFKDKITSVLTGERTAGGREITQSENQSEVDYWGIEAGARYRIVDTLSLYGSATYTRGREKSDGRTQPADRVPPLFGKLGAEWLASDRLTLEFYAYFADDQQRLSDRDLTDPRINPQGTPGWGTLNARVTWAVSERATLSMRVENLLDERYREHASGLDEPGLNALFTVDYRM